MSGRHDKEKGVNVQVLLRCRYIVNLFLYNYVSLYNYICICIYLYVRIYYVRAFYIVMRIVRHGKGLGFYFPNNFSFKYQFRM